MPLICCTKNRLATLRRDENLRRRRKIKEQTRSNFFKDPYKFVKNLFTKEKSGKLKTSKKIWKLSSNRVTLTASDANRQFFHLICHRYIPQSISWMPGPPGGAKWRELYGGQELHPPLGPMESHTGFIRTHQRYCIFFGD